MHRPTSCGTDLWEIPCDALDPIVTGAFPDWRELSNMIGAAGVQVCADGKGLSEADRLVLAAHQLCHEPTSFACRLQRLLGLRFKQTVARVRELSPEAVGRRCAADPLEELHPLPGWIWGVASDPRPEVRRVLPVLLVRLRLSGLRLLHATTAAEA